MKDKDIITTIRKQEKGPTGTPYAQHTVLQRFAKYPLHIWPGTLSAMRGEITNVFSLYRFDNPHYKIPYAETRRLYARIMYRDPQLNPDCRFEVLIHKLMTEYLTTEDRAKTESALADLLRRINDLDGQIITAMYNKKYNKAIGIAERQAMECGAFAHQKTYRWLSEAYLRAGNLDKAEEIHEIYHRMIGYTERTWNRCSNPFHDDLSNARRQKGIERRSKTRRGRVQNKLGFY